MQAGFEKRKYLRVKHELPVGYIILEGESSVSREERTIDLSPAGIMFSMDHPAVLFELFGFEICLNSRPLIVSAIGEVRWVKRIGDCEKYYIGIQFLQITHEDRERIADYVYTKDLQIRSLKENQN